MEGGNYSKKVRFFFKERFWNFRRHWPVPAPFKRRSFYRTFGKKKSYTEKSFQFFFSGGPDWYWSRQKKSQVDRTFFPQQQMKCGFFGGLFWRARLISAPLPQKNPDRTISCQDRYLSVQERSGRLGGGTHLHNRHTYKAAIMIRILYFIYFYWKIGGGEEGGGILVQEFFFFKFFLSIVKLFVRLRENHASSYYFFSSRKKKDDGGQIVHWKCPRRICANWLIINLKKIKIM